MESHNAPHVSTSSIDSRNVDRTGLSRAVSRINQALCGLSGHDAVRTFEGKRVMMRCTSCGHETPGWEVNEQGPRRLFEGDARRHRMVREPRLVLRKTA